MKASFVVLAGASLVAAQNGLPTCAESCVSNFTTGQEIGGCNSLDIKCICSQQTFLSDIACCLAGACDAADQQTAIGYAQNICGTAGVTVPSSVVCTANATTTGNASTSATASATKSTTSSTTTTTANAGSSAAGLVSTSASVLGALLAALAFL